MTNNTNIKEHEKSILGVAKVDFEAKVSSKKFIEQFGGDAFRNATMTIFNQEGEEFEIDVTEFVISHLREYEDQDDFNGEVIIGNKN